MFYDRLPLLCGPMLLLGAACQAAPTAKVPSYPPLPAALAASSAPTFVPDGQAAQLRLACAPSEPTHANGLDDDCDGHIDGVHAQHAVLTVTAQPGLVAALRLVPMQEESAASAQATGATRPFPDADTAPFEVLRLDLPALPRGRYAVELSAGTAPDEAAPSHAALTIAAGGETHNYGLRIQPHTTVRVGYLDIP